MPRNSSSSPAPVNVPLLRVFTLGQFRLERSSLTSVDTNDTADTPSSNPQWHVVTEAAWQQRQDSQVRALLGLSAL